MKTYIKIFLTFLFIALFSFTETSAKPYYYDDYERFEKVIKINTYANKLSYYEKGERIGEMPISSGDEENFTPEGRFVITNKHERMLSSSAGKWMPYWMEFWNGEYGIHALPEDYNGNLDTSSTIGEVAAGGCVRLTKDDALKLYEWADYGTYVLIDYNKNEYASIENDENTIKKYYELINEEKFEEAYDMRLNRGFSLEKFISLNKSYRFEINEITQINGGEFVIKTTIYRGETIVNRQRAKFFISDGKIVRSFVLKG